MTNVNKVLSGQQWRIDSIKWANVPLACLSFNHITGSLLHILPRGQTILHHICVHMSSRVWVCVYDNVCVCGIFVFACGRHHFTFIETSSSPWGTCTDFRPAAMLASIDSPGLRLGWGSRSSVAPERWPTPGQSSVGEDRVSSPGHRLGAPTFPVETWKHEHTNSHIKKVCSGKSPTGKRTTGMYFSAWYIHVQTKWAVFLKPRNFHAAFLYYTISC